MCQAMVQLGHQITLITPKCKVARELQGIDIWQHYGIMSPFQLKRIVKFSVLGEQAHSLISILCAVRAKADVIYTRNLRSALIGISMKIPVICEVHQMPGGYGGPFYLRGFSLARKTPKILVPITNSLKEDLISSFPKEMKRLRVAVAPDGVDIERFENLPDVMEARCKLGLNLNGFVAGYSGHFYKGKGLELVLELGRRCPKITFLIMGGYPHDLIELKKKIRNNRITNVLPQGFIPNLKLPIYLAACDALLLPNQKSVSGSGGGNIGRWTSPLKLFEYMASKRFVIASDLPVLREVLSEENAILCNPEKISEWESALLRASKDKLFRQSLAARLYKKAHKYTWTSRVEYCMEALNNEIQILKDK
jgi:glycosyltransferase involved in cell wall biosynthesis